MRLIDADAMIVSECGQCDGACDEFDGQKCLECCSHNKCQLREAIDNADTVDAQPVIRCKDCAHWKPCDEKSTFAGHKELGDVAWYLAVTAHAIGYTLEDVMRGNMKKLRARYPEGFDPEKSLYRKEGDV